MRGRNLVDDAILTMGAAAEEETEELVRWFCAFVVATKCYLRRTTIPPEQLAGILTPDEVERMEKRAPHTPLYCAHMMRAAIVRAMLLRDTADTEQGEQS